MGCFNVLDTPYAKITVFSKFFYGEPHGKNKENGKRRRFRGERGGDNPCQEQGIIR